MNFEEFASDLPRHRAVRFSSAEENEEAMRDEGVTQELRQLGRGRFHCEMVSNETEKVALFADRFNKAFTMYLAPPIDTVGILIPRTVSGDFHASGENLGENKMAVILPDFGADIVVPDLIGSEAFMVTKERFAELTDTLCPAMEKLEYMTVVDGDATELASLRNEILFLASSEPGTLSDEQADNLVARAISWLGRYAGGCEKERVRGAAARSRIARCAREYIEDYYRMTLRIEDLCNVTGVGARSLQPCFKDYFGITISNYIKTVRLDSARRELEAEHPARVTVTDVAMRNGFTHLGRFSVEFRKRFGESPRETLAN